MKKIMPGFENMTDIHQVSTINQMPVSTHIVVSAQITSN